MMDLERGSWSCSCSTASGNNGERRIKSLGGRQKSRRQNPDLATPVGTICGRLRMATAIDVLLATYQGATFLRQQLDSLFAQSCQQFRVLARDDGSTDGTRAILESYAASYPGRLSLLPSDGRRLGASGSFARLLEESRAPYVMFCDQDDSWLPNKVASTLAAMREQERIHGELTPALVCTDLRVVDERLGLIDESFWHFQRIHPRRLGRLSRVLIQNFAAGCTVMINRALADLSLPIPERAVMHDWWLAVVATRFGRVVFLPEATVLYRQHGRNDVGARRWRFMTGIENFFLHRERRRSLMAEHEDTYDRVARQAAAFGDYFGGQLLSSERAAIAALVSFSDRGFWGRRYLMLRHSLLPSDRWQAFVGLLR